MPGVASRAACASRTLSKHQSLLSRERLRILFVASEVEPFAKTGGLADVTGALPQALEALGHDVRVILPRYRGVERAAGKLEPVLPRLDVPIGDGTVEGSVVEGRTGKAIPVYLVGQDRYYDRPTLYGTQEGDYPDNCERFVFFCRAVMEVAAAAGLDAARRPLPRLADRAHPGLRRDPLPRHGVPRRGHGVHRPQPRLPGAVLALRPPDDGAGLGPLHAGRHRVLREAQPAQGRARLRRPAHDRQPHVRPGDPDAGVRRGARRRAARPVRRPGRHPQRPRRGGVEPGA